MILLYVLIGMAVGAFTLFIYNRLENYQDRIQRLENKKKYDFLHNPEADEK